MSKNSFKLISLSHGDIVMYDFNGIILHCYRSNDAMDDQVIIVENGDQAVVIENPSFVDGSNELTKYIKKIGLSVVGKILAYHMAGAQFLPNVPVYSTQKAVDFALCGAGAAMVTKFKKSFGKSFDSSIAEVSNIVKDELLSLAGLHFKLMQTEDAFDVEIVDINVLYTHMLGHDTHSIVPSLKILDTTIERLRGYQLRNYTLVLSAHHTPEDNYDIQTKIHYLEQLQQITTKAQSTNDFTSKMKRAFPDYKGEHYLEMTATFLF